MLLNKEVAKIAYDPSNTSADRIHVKCSDGTEYLYDHLICTVSLGVLKKLHLTLFEPMLPQIKIDSIQGMGFGTVDKVFVEFTKPFWKPDWEGVSFFWKPDELRDVREDPVNGDWLSSVIGFYTVSYQPNVLCAFIAGSGARKMEHITEANLKSGVERVLHLFLRDWKESEIKRVIRWVYFFSIGESSKNTR